MESPTGKPVSASRRRAGVRVAAERGSSRKARGSELGNPKLETGTTYYTYSYTHRHTRTY
eukprot:6111819-Alexandrium_andersonii.AAC.1